MFTTKQKVKMDRQRLNDEYLNVDQQLRDLRTRHRNLHLNYGAYLKTEQTSRSRTV